MEKLPETVEFCSAEPREYSSERLVGIRVSYPKGRSTELLVAFSEATVTVSEEGQATGRKFPHFRLNPRSPRGGVPNPIGDGSLAYSKGTIATSAGTIASYKPKGVTTPAIPIKNR